MSTGSEVSLPQEPLKLFSLLSSFRDDDPCLHDPLDRLDLYANAPKSSPNLACG